MNAHVHPAFRDILNDFADGGRSFSRFEREMYPEACAIAETPRERCASCDKLHPEDELVRTLDGPTCQACMELQRSEAEAELKEIDGAAGMMTRNVKQVESDRSEPCKVSLIRRNDVIRTSAESAGYAVGGASPSASDHPGMAPQGEGTGRHHNLGSQHVGSCSPDLANQDTATGAAQRIPCHIQTAGSGEAGSSPADSTKFGTRRAVGARSTDYALDLHCAASADIARSIIEAQL